MDEVQGSFVEAVDSMTEAMRVVGQNMTTAIGEVALDVGGEELVERTQQLARGNSNPSDDVFPDPTALEYLEDVAPGSAERVMTRMQEIGDERRAAEMAELRNPFSKRSRKAIFDGIGMLGWNGTDTKRRRR